MALTQTRTSTDLIVDEDLDMNGNAAKNAQDATAPQELATKKQLDDTADQITQLMKWQATQW